MTLWSPQFKTWPVVVSDLYDCWRGGSLQAGEVCVCVCVSPAPCDVAEWSSHLRGSRFTCLVSGWPNGRPDQLMVQSTTTNNELSGVCLHIAFLYAYASP